MEQPLTRWVRSNSSTFQDIFTAVSEATKKPSSMRSLWRPTWWVVTTTGCTPSDRSRAEFMQKYHRLFPKEVRRLPLCDLIETAVL